MKLGDEFLESGRGRIIDVLRRGTFTVEQIAAELHVTGNAVRAHLTTLERDGLVRSAGSRRGATRPSRTYELTPELEHLLSRAYMPLLSELVRLFAAQETPAKFDAIMRQAGRGVAKQLSAGVAEGSFGHRVTATAELLNRELGASTTVERSDGGYVIRGSGCPLAALTGKHPGVCHAIESLVAELLHAPVHECCDRVERPKCCLEVSPPRAKSQSRSR